MEQVLDSLDPPVKHEVLQDGEKLSILLLDPHVPASVQRNLSRSEYNDPVYFRLILLYAINELRGKGSHAPLEILPVWE